MLARRDQWRPLLQSGAALDHPESAIAAALEEMLAEELASAVQTLGPAWQAPWMPLARFAAANLGEGALADWDRALSAQSDDLPRWRALAAFLLTLDDTPAQGGQRQERLPRRQGVQSAEGRHACRAGGPRRGCRRRPGAPAPPAGWRNTMMTPSCAPWLRLMKLAAAELWLVFREAGEVDFGELAARAIAALGDDMDPTELGLRLDWRIRHLLVDEFQDTSPTQVELLQRLTAGWQPG
jgi:ATP-dependent helicase/nuclease subunit A